MGTITHYRLFQRDPRIGLSVQLHVAIVGETVVEENGADLTQLSGDA